MLPKRLVDFITEIVLERWKAVPDPRLSEIMQSMISHLHAFVRDIEPTTAGIEAENAGSASGLFNMTRNLGGAVGIALLQTLLTKREQYHSNVLMQSVSLLEQATRSRIEKLTQYFMAHGVTD